LHVLTQSFDPAGLRITAEDIEEYPLAAESLQPPLCWPTTASTRSVGERDDRNTFASDADAVLCA
jgi:hypothetical protein